MVIRFGRLLFATSLVCAGTSARAQPAPEPTTPSDAPAPAPPPPAGPAEAPPPPSPPPPVLAPPVTAPEPPAPSPASNVALSQLSLSGIHVHGFISEGGFVSTANDYIGHSSRGSLELFEAGLNVSTDLTSQLRAGLQLFSQDEGVANDPTPRLDWAFLDYHWQRWLGVRVGRVKIPFGLYNEYVDIDASRAAILLPQSLYPVSNRSILTAQTGFLAYGNVPLKAAGELDYEVYAGELSAPLPGAQDANGNRVYALDSKYVVGGQVFWHPPVEGLRVGGSLLRASLDEYINLSPALTGYLITLGLAPANFDGNVVYGLRPASLWVASAEYVHDDWLFAAEYSRWYARTPYSPAIVPPGTSLSERFYALATYHVTPRIDTSLYYSLVNKDLHDRGGTNKDSFPQSFEAWQRDAAATLRYDVNDHWLWKVEAHVIDGTGDPNATFLNKDLKRFWGLFLLRTTVTF